MHITESSLDAHLPVSAPIEAMPADLADQPAATIWQTLHGHAPMSSLVWKICFARVLLTKATEQNELEISTDENGRRILDLYTEVWFSPFVRSRTERVEFHGFDLVDFICADPDLMIRVNHGTSVELRIEATLLRKLGQELRNSREPGTTHETISIGTATNENTGAQ